MPAPAGRGGGNYPSDDPHLFMIKKHPAGSITIEKGFHIWKEQRKLNGPRKRPA